MPVGEPGMRAFAARVGLLHGAKELGLQALAGAVGEQLERLAQRGDRERDLIDRGSEVVKDRGPRLERGDRH